MRLPPWPRGASPGPFDLSGDDVTNVTSVLPFPILSTGEQVGHRNNGQCHICVDPERARAGSARAKRAPRRPGRGFSMTAPPTRMVLPVSIGSGEEVGRGRAHLKPTRRRVPRDLTQSFYVGAGTLRAHSFHGGPCALDVLHPERQHASDCGTDHGFSAGGGGEEAMMLRVFVEDVVVLLRLRSQRRVRLGAGRVGWLAGEVWPVSVPS